MQTDLLNNILSRADNPAEFGGYLAQEVRELTGARCTLLIQYTGDATEITDRVLAVDPIQERGWAESPAAGRLRQMVRRLPDAQFWDARDSSEAAGLLREDGFERSMVLPLDVGACRIGAVMALGLPDERRAMAGLNLLQALSATVAMSLLNMVLRAKQEQAIEELAQQLKTSDARLRASESRLQESQRASRLSSYVLDIRDGVWVSSETVDAVFGIDASYPKTLEGWMAIIHPDDREPMRRHLADLSAARRQLSMEFRVVRPCDGQERWVFGLGKLVLDENGAPTKLSGTIQDITERKLIEEALRQERALLQNIADTSPVGITTIDLNGRITFANPQATKLLGLTTGEAPRGTSDSVRHVTDATGNLFPFENLAFARVMATGQPVYGERHAIAWPDGKRLFLSVSAAPLTTDSGELHGVVATMEDITERILAEEKRTRLEEQLRQSQKMEAIGRLAGGVAHDLNNLLTPIMGYAEMLTAGLAAEDQRQEYLKQIGHAAERARDLTRQLLAFGRKQVLSLKAVDLRVVIAEFETILRRTIREDIRIELSMPQSLGTVRADTGQMELVLMNLAVNAQDAMPHGGILGIALRDSVLDETYVPQEPGLNPGRYVLMTVSDTGIGIDKPTQARMFEPFFTTKKLGQGTGLGLSTVHGIIRQHGGQIHVSSEPGDGTTFSVYLPCTVEAPQPPELPVKPVSGSGNGAKIMLVEDDETVRNMVSRLLRSWGFQVLEVESGLRCLETADATGWDIDLLLTDVIMPAMNGPELFQQMCSRRPDLRVLYMSGYPREVIARHGNLGNGVQFIKKPFMASELFQKIQNILRSE